LIALVAVAGAVATTTSGSTGARGAMQGRWLLGLNDDNGPLAFSRQSSQYTPVSDFSTHCTIYIISLLAIVFGLVQFWIISWTKVESAQTDAAYTPVESTETGDKASLNLEICMTAAVDLAEKGERSKSPEEQTALLKEIHTAITIGAKAFLFAEYKVCGDIIMTVLIPLCSF